MALVPFLVFIAIFIAYVVYDIRRRKKLDEARRQRDAEDE